MAAGAWTQAGYDVRFDWAAAGAAHVGARGVLVVVDVLLFTTAVGVAVERGTAVHPAPARDAAAAFGEDVEVAVEADASDVVPALVDGAFRRT